MDMTGLTLEERDALPDPLRVLVTEYPREGWAAHPNFQGTVAFWLDRHMMFRKVLAMLQSEAEQMIDARLDPRSYGARLSQLGGSFVNQLHGHHQIEDMHYFPVLQAQDTRVARGFDILDHDHHAIDGHLNAFVEAANGVLQVVDDPVKLHDAAGGFRDHVARLEGFLGRHLDDEEELVVPVILKYGPNALP